MAAQPGWADEFRQTFRLAAPIVLTQLSQVAMMVTDTVMIGRLGGDALAATTLATLSFFLIFVGSLGIVMATAPLAAQHVGARQPRMVRRVVRQGLWVSAMVTVPGCLALSHIDVFLLAVGQEPRLVAAAQDYMATLLWSLPTAVGFIVLRNFVASLGRPVPAMLVMFAGIPVNAALNYVLIYGNFGAPPLGLAGAGLATAIVDLLMFLVLLWVALRRLPFRRYAILSRFWRPDWEVFRRIFTIGLPISGILLLEFGFFAAGSLMMGWLGVTALAAHQIAIQVPHVTFMVPMGVGQAATVRVGHAVGRRDAAGARRAGWAALVLGLGFMFAASVVIWSMPMTLAGFFVDSADPANGPLIKAAAGLLLVAAAFQLFDGAQAIGAGALRGLNDTRIPFLLAFSGYWIVGCSSAYAIGFWTDLGAKGVWLGLAIGLSVTAVLLVSRFWLLTRRGYLPTVHTGKQGDAELSVSTAAVTVAGSGAIADVRPLAEPSDR